MWYCWGSPLIFLSLLRRSWERVSSWNVIVPPKDYSSRREIKQKSAGAARSGLSPLRSSPASRLHRDRNTCPEKSTKHRQVQFFSQILSQPAPICSSRVYTQYYLWLFLKCLCFLNILRSLTSTVVIGVNRKYPFTSMR